MTNNRIVIKVGTSTITRDGGPPDREYLASLASQIAAQRAMGRDVILVTSAAIRAGMDALGLDGRPRTIPQKQAAAAVGMGRLMQMYGEVFAAHGIVVAAPRHVARRRLQEKVYETKAGACRGLAIEAKQFERIAGRQVTGAWPRTSCHRRGLNHR